MPLVSHKLKNIKVAVQNVLLQHRCNKYSPLDRHALVYLSNHKLRHLLTSALRAHQIALQSPYTPLASPVQVYCPDTLEEITNLDLRVSLRLKLGSIIETFEELVSWYLAVAREDEPTSQ